MHKQSRSVLVVGAGIFGVTAALELVSRGWSVTLVDQGAIPHEDAASTDLSKVIRADYGADDLYTAWMDEALDGWAAWNARWARPLYHPSGFLLLRGSPMAPGEFEYESHAKLVARGFPLERLTAARLEENHPAWKDAGFVDGYQNARGGWAESGAVVATLVDEARARGVTVVESFPVEALVTEAERVVGVRGPRVLRADAVVVAAGTWTTVLLPELADRLETIGQPVFHLRPDDVAAWSAPRFPAWAADITSTGWYGFPAHPRGVLKIANHGPGVKLDPRAPREVSDDQRASLRAFLAARLPSLVDAPLVGERLCTYSDSFDGDFFIDAVPDRPGAFVAAGGSGHGFKFAPVLGELIADVVTGRVHRHATRFAWRARGARAREAARHG